jgi:hypothetical protein
MELLNQPLTIDKVARESEVSNCNLVVRVLNDALVSSMVIINEPVFVISVEKKVGGVTHVTPTAPKPSLFRFALCGTAVGRRLQAEAIRFYARLSVGDIVSQRNGRIGSIRLPRVENDSAIGSLIHLEELGKDRSPIQETTAFPFSLGDGIEDWYGNNVSDPDYLACSWGWRGESPTTRWFLACHQPAITLGDPWRSRGLGVRRATSSRGSRRSKRSRRTSIRRRRRR